MFGEAGDDALNGDAGDDTLSGGIGGDVLAGGEGNDTLNGDEGNDQLVGGNGTDILNGGADNDVLAGLNGNDTLSGGTGNDTLDGGSDTDLLNGGDDDDTVQGGSGNDTVNGDAGNDVGFGGDGNDTLNGGFGDDVLLGEAGSDAVNGNDGIDILSGGSGTDTLNGGAGDDVLMFEAERGFSKILNSDVFALNSDGDFTASTGIQLNAAGGLYQGSFDTYNGDAGYDMLLGTGGHDVVFRYALNDADGTRTGLLISGVEEFEMGNGDDLVDLTAKLGTGGQSAPGENVTIYGGNGRDALWASGGNDTIEGGNDGDWLSGGTGDDTIYGGNRTGGDTNAVVDVWTVTGVTGQFTDLLDGGAGNDQLFGGSGNDLLSGGSGTDRLTGGDGADRFLFRKPAGAGSWGNDTVTDFNYAAGDRLIAFNWDKTKVTATDTTDGLKIDYLLGNSITLTGVTSTNLDALHLTVNDLFT